MSLEKRFWAKVTKGTSHECWLWKASGPQGGYGSIRTDGNLKELAHRVSYRLNVGPIPDGMHVLHRCDVRRCVNPAHLFLGSNADNMRDRDSKGRGSKPPLHCGESHPRAKVTDAEVAQIRLSNKATCLIAAEFGISQSQVSAIRTGSSRNGQQ